MYINGIEHNLIECQKCGYEWFSKICPKQCPKCHRYSPWLPKASENEQVVRANKYPIQHLEVGQSTVLPWQSGPDGKPDFVANESMQRAVRQEEARKGKKFEKEPRSAGLFLRRIF